MNIAVHDPGLPELLIRQLPEEYRTHRAVCLGNAGGFSGARIWQLLGASMSCLRQWPRDVSQPRVREVHASLNMLFATGIDFVPVPIEWRDGSTALSADGHWWELTRWLPGAAATERHPSLPRITAAMRGLAQIHLAWERFATDRTSRSIPAVQRRWQLIEHADNVLDLASRREDALPGPLPWIVARITEPIRQQLPGIRQRLTVARHWNAPLQRCIRDVRRGHLLFQADQLSGIVDFDATGWDSVSTDVARLLADWDPSVRASALEAYAAIRPLTDREFELVDLLCRANPVLSGLQWLHWLLWEGRSFEDWDRVAQRLIDCLDSIGAERGGG